MWARLQQTMRRCCWPAFACNEHMANLQLMTYVQRLLRTKLQLLICLELKHRSATFFCFLGGL